MNNPEINVRGLTRRFAQSTAVDHIDLSVSEGDIFGLLGANGAGKSTDIKMLTTLLRPSAGSMRICPYGAPFHEDRRSNFANRYEECIDMNSKQVLFRSQAREKHDEPAASEAL